MYHQRTILLVDEIHRFNKAQQDALLPHVENGTIILIGATTENPYFEVIGPLVSRSRVFQLKPLSDDNVRDLIQRALADVERGYGGLLIDLDRRGAGASGAGRGRRCAQRPQRPGTRRRIHRA